MYTVYVKPFPYSKVNEKTAAAVFLVLHLQKGVKTNREMYTIYLQHNILGLKTTQFSNTVLNILWWEMYSQWFVIWNGGNKKKAIN